MHHLLLRDEGGAFGGRLDTIIFEGPIRFTETISGGSNHALRIFNSPLSSNNVSYIMSGRGIDDDNDDDDATVSEIFNSIFSCADKIGVAADEARWNTFGEEFKNDFAKNHKSRGTLLHVMAFEKKAPNHPRYELLKWLVRKRPELLFEKDADNLCPLNSALEQKKTLNQPFVDAVLSVCNDETITKALKVPNSGGNTCLHQAIKMELSSTMELIGKCSKMTEIFTVQNSDGNTPLHLAMVLTTSPGAKPTGSEDKGNGPRRDEVSHRKEGLPVSNRGSIKNEDPHPRSKDQGTKNKEPASKNEDPSQDHKLTRRNTPLQDLSNTARKLGAEPGETGANSKRKRKNAFYLPEVVLSLLSRSKDSMVKLNNEGKTPYQYRLSEMTKKAGSNSPVSRILDVEEDEIVHIMKDYCLKNLEREEAIKVLYEKGKGNFIATSSHSFHSSVAYFTYLERHIEFDLSGLPSPSIPETYLERLAKHLQFENCLQYVALPKLRVERVENFKSKVPNADSGSNHNLPLLSDCVGLTDAQFVFAWLRRNNVKKIIKVIVVDDGDIPHSEDAIEASLKNFGVEVWDWRKLDICSDTIFRAAKDVRIVNLYSSGNNAVLQSWSGEKGLVKLERV